MVPNAEQAEAGEGEGEDQGHHVVASERTKLVVDRMTQRLGFWNTRVDAALFLASLAVAEQAEPVPEEELSGELMEICDLHDAIEGIDDVGELALFQLVRGPERELGDLLQDELTGLIEAGTRILEPKLRDQGPAGAAEAVAGLLMDGAR